MKQYYVYLLASEQNGTLYTGITSDLKKRIWEHKNNIIKSFTKKYDVHNLVYYEIHGDVEQALLREKKIKKWRRTWKLKLIESMNPKWEDLYDELFW